MTNNKNPNIADDKDDKLGNSSRNGTTHNQTNGQGYEIKITFSETMLVNPSALPLSKNHEIFDLIKFNCHRTIKQAVQSVKIVEVNKDTPVGISQIRTKKLIICASG